MMQSQARPTSIRIFLADGVPEGLRIVEKSNWTGRAVVAGRAQLSQALSRDELGQPGVYVLTGPAEEGTSRLYVGEADVLRDRLRQHVAGKDFWTRFVAFTSTNEGLNKAHVRYLEARLLELAKAANQWSLENGTSPASPPLSEPDRADAEWFLQEMLVIFPLLGIDAFEAAAGQAREGAVGEALLDETLYLEERGAKATGREVGDGFVVFEGSRARATEVASIHDYMHDLRVQLLERQVLRVDGDALVFTQDYRFNSPSTAAGVLVGGAANGRIAWKDEAGRTLKALQNARAQSVGGDG
ncbi:GIY-YIG nuclease family protein [Billgrantia saliphila]|uniref:GIY-YIG nuclease family protein n=1 Tax=Billgrantia saliphila TaxID=1848458 RepID=UPI000CE54396|nr:GIY-YIG nuclease family protein [Halomonas saliphila]